MSPIQYTLVGAEDGSANISVFVPGKPPQVAHSSHPNFQNILDKVMVGDDTAYDLFDVAYSAAQKFESLSERISVANGRLYLDGEEVHNTLATQVLRFLEEGVDNWKPLVRFFENVQANPQDHSREQLFDWLQADSFTITDEGLIVGYKGVRSDGNGGYKSINTGKAIVNGEIYWGAIPNPLGAIVEMPRGEVVHDPFTHCSRGLHVGTYGYASGFSRGAVLEVHVNPRDVVSVPNDSGGQKMRCCRYKVVKVIEQPYSQAVVTGYWSDDDDEDGDYEWGEADSPDQYVFNYDGEPRVVKTATAFVDGGLLKCTQLGKGYRTFKLDKIYEQNRASRLSDLLSF